MNANKLYLALAPGFLLWVFFQPQITSVPAAESYAQSGVFQGDNGKVTLKSDAPLELIEARSHKLRGAIDPEKQTFAWSLDVKTLEGFNSPLQREHFNENYLESNKYPKASFSGKIIEKVDLNTDGMYAIRAKGKLLLHGVEQERIIKSTLEIKNGKAIVHATFSVLLADHDINIPRIVYQKIAEEVMVTVDAELKKQQ